MRSYDLSCKVWNNLDLKAKAVLFIGSKIKFAWNLSKGFCPEKVFMQLVSRKVFYADLARALYL
jgi:hypothetical protein